MSISGIKAHHQVSNLVQAIYPHATNGVLQSIGFFTTDGDERAAQELALQVSVLLSEGSGKDVFMIDLYPRKRGEIKELVVPPGSIRALLDLNTPLETHVRQYGKSKLRVLAIAADTSDTLCGDDSDSDVCERLWRERSPEIRELRRSGHIVLVAPSVGLRAAFEYAVGLTSGMVQVVQAGKTRRKSAKSTLDDACAAGARVLGVVMINRLFPVPNWALRLL